MSSGAERGWFAMSAFCAWVYDWRAARQRGDTAGAERAVAVINGAPRWPAVLAEDPHLKVMRPVPGQTPDWAENLFGWFLPFRSAIRNGDSAEVSHLIATNYGTAGCSYFKPQVGSDNGTRLPAKFLHHG